MAAIARRTIPLHLPKLSPAALRYSKRSIAPPQWQLQPAPRSQPQPQIRTFRTSPSALEKKYTKDHEWIELNDDKTQGTIGISTYAASALGDVVYVELPTLDLQVSAGDSIGAVESVKSASDIMTPVAGKVVETNEVLEEKPGTINKSPEGEGWIARIELLEKGGGEGEGLMGEEEYRAFVEE